MLARQGAAGGSSSGPGQPSTSGRGGGAAPGSGQADAAAREAMRSKLTGIAAALAGHDRERMKAQVRVAHCVAGEGLQVHAWQGAWADEGKGVGAVAARSWPK